MKQLIALFMVLAVCVGHAQAQTKEQREKARAERKALEARQDSLLYAEAKKSLESKDFVLEADQVIFKRGMTAFVSSSTNFVAVHGDRATVQVSSNLPFSGPNGLGGITVDGSVSGYEVSYGKKGEVYVSMNVTGVGISAQLNITLPKGTNQGSVDIYPNFNSNRLTLEGEVVPREESGVFKGTPL